MKTKGVILAGGMGTRLYPLTTTLNKHLLPIGHDLMITYPLKTIIKTGITEILIVLGGHNSEAIISHLGNGTKYGVQIYYAHQQEANGVAGALKQAKKFISNHHTLALLGDNIFIDDIQTHIQSAESGIAINFIKEVNNPQDYGILTENEAITKIIEKPKNIYAPAKAITGAYFYPPDVYDKIDTLTPSQRNELEITDINNQYLNEGRLKLINLEKEWYDCGSSINQYQQINSRLSQND